MALLVFINQLESVESNMWGFTETATTDASGAFLADIKIASSSGFTELDGSGFGGASTTRFEFVEPDASVSSLFKSVGMTHINVMLQVNYAGETTGPLSTSGLVLVEAGVNVTTGIANDTDAEDYATVKSINTTTLPSQDLTEQYVVSIPISVLSLSNNVIFDAVARVRIVGSTFVDNAATDGLPLMEFGKVRIIISSYSIAGNILEEDGTTTSLAAVVGDIL